VRRKRVRAPKKGARAINGHAPQKVDAPRKVRAPQKGARAAKKNARAANSYKLKFQ
jgi:hypothetical protein